MLNNWNRDALVAVLVVPCVARLFNYKMPNTFVSKLSKLKELQKHIRAVYLKVLFFQDTDDTVLRMMKYV